MRRKAGAASAQPNATPRSDSTSGVAAIAVVPQEPAVAAERRRGRDEGHRRGAAGLRLQPVQAGGVLRHLAGRVGVAGVRQRLVATTGAAKDARRESTHGGNMVSIIKVGELE